MMRYILEHYRISAFFGLLVIVAFCVMLTHISHASADGNDPWENVGGDRWVKSVCDHDNRVYVVRNQNYSAVGITVIEGACK